MLLLAGGNRRRISLFLRPLLLVFLASASPLFATDISWDGSSSTAWTTKFNWTGNTTPGSTDNAKFDGTFTNQPTLGTSAATVGGLWMATGVGQNVTIGGTGTLTLASNTINGTAGLGILVNNSSAFTLTINAPIALGATQAWTNNSSNLLTIGAVNLSTFALTVNGTGSSTISGVVSGSGSLSKAGTGTLTLSGTNTYTGVTTISAGILSISSLANGSSNSNIGASTNAAANLVLNGGTLSYTGAAVSTDRLFSIGTSSGTLDSSGSGAINFTNTGAMGFNGQSGARTLTLTGTNTGSNTLAAIIGDNGAATSLTKSGTGTWVLTGANTYTGATAISAGILNIQNATALGTTAGATTISSGATLQLQGGITVGAEALTISGTGAAGQNGALVNVSGTNNYGGLLTLGAATTISSDSGTLNLTNVGTITGATFGLTLTGAGSGSVSSIIGTTSGTLTKSGAGTWTLTGADTYTGSTSINAGILNIQNATALGTIASGTTVSSGATLQLQGGITVGVEALTLSGTGASGQNGALVNVSGTNNYGGLLTLGAAATISSDSGTLNLTNTGTITGATFDLTLAGAGSGSVSSIIGTTSGKLVKAGAGTWTLTGANTYTGTTTISAGILNIQNATALGTTAAGTTVSNNATLQLQGGITVGSEALTISSTGAAGQNGALVNVSGTNNYGGLLTLGAAATISSDSGTLNLTNTGTITGATFGLTLTGSGSGSVSSIIGTTTGSLTKSGSGTWTLAGVNTYTGATTVNAGTLSVTGSLASGSAVTVNNSGSVLEGTGTIFGSVSIASNGAILEAGTGSTGQTLTMRGAVTMGSGSIIALSLGASGAHSTLAIGIGGTISFQSLQKFNIIDLGVTSGSTYNGLITGIGSDPGTESGWTITNQNWAYHFSYDASNGGEIDLSVTALPEPSTYVTGVLTLLALGYTQRARLRKVIATS